jgi:hypothetical protein
VAAPPLRQLPHLSLGSDKVLRSSNPEPWFVSFPACPPTVITKAFHQLAGHFASKGSSWRCSPAVSPFHDGVGSSAGPPKCWVSHCNSSASSQWLQPSVVPMVGADVPTCLPRWCLSCPPLHPVGFGPQQIIPPKLVCMNLSTRAQSGGMVCRCKPQSHLLGPWRERDFQGRAGGKCDLWPLSWLEAALALHQLSFRREAICLQCPA